MCCTLLEHANTYVLFPSAHTHTHTYGRTALDVCVSIFPKIDTPGLLQHKGIIYKTTLELDVICVFHNSKGFSIASSNESRIPTLGGWLGHYGKGF